MNNIDIISDNYEDIASGKLQIRRFQQPHSVLTTVIWWTLSSFDYLETIYIARNKSHCPDSMSLFFTFHAIIFLESQKLSVKKCWPTTD